MRLALVYPPFFAKPFNENLPTVDDEFGLFPHIGFGWAARGARAAGWDVRLWDAPAEKKSLERVLQEVEAWNPDLVGFSAHACQTIRDMLSWSKAFRSRMRVPIVVGGYEAKVYAPELLGHGCFDFLCAAEGHEFLPSFLEAFEHHGRYDQVPDLFYVKAGSVTRTFRGPRSKFSEYPTPDRSIFPNHRYYSHVSQRRHFTIGMSQIGCPYPCTFCCMRQSGWDARSAEQIVDEMQECVALGIHEVDWFDPLMLNDRERALDIAREVKRRKLDVIWSCRSRVDSLSFHGSRRSPDLEMIQTLAEGGCRRIYFGIESGDDTVLKGMMKGQSTSRELVATLSAVKEAGIMALGFFIVGAPGDTKESVKRTVDFSLEVPLYYAQYQIAMIKPHTELERRHIVEELGVDYWREYVAGRIDEYLLPTPWTDLGRAELERMARRAYLRFYARPKYVMRMLGRVQSWDELRRYLRVGAQLAIRPLRPSTAKSALKRLGRAALAFGEAALTVASPGARHAVFSRGGGLRGAISMARDELDRKAPEEMLTKERVDELRRTSKNPPHPPPSRIHARYVPLFDEPDANDGVIQLGKAVSA